MMGDNEFETICGLSGQPFSGCIVMQLENV